MTNMEEIVENTVIDSWVCRFRRSPHQVNQAHETDAELILIQGDPHHYLALTIDTVAEEITTGLYRDPYTMGWVTVMASMSDLAAVGADPVGMVLSVSVEATRDKAFTDRVALGVEDACRTLSVFILGGDTNVTPTISLTGCAFGRVSREKVMTRCGCKPGDALFVTGGIGVGNALGLVRLRNDPDALFSESLYRPRARIREAQTIRNYATCCMDTSDGLLTTLDQLMRLNGFGCAIDCDWSTILAPEVLEFCNRTGTPHWFMTAGPHGEFELVFTVPKERVKPFRAEVQVEGINALQLGRVQESPDISLILPSERVVGVDVAPLRNLLYEVDGDLKRFLHEFEALGKKWGINTTSTAHEKGKGDTRKKIGEEG